MSYILDALQRADQERSLGEVPKLDMALKPGVGSQRRSRWSTALIIVLLASLVACVGWLLEQGVLDNLFDDPAEPTVVAQPAALQPIHQPAAQATPEPPAEVAAAKPAAPASVAPAGSLLGQDQAPSPQVATATPAEPVQAAPAQGTNPQPEPPRAIPAEPTPAKPVAPESDNRSPRLPTPTVAPAPPPSWARNGGNQLLAPREAAPRQPLVSYLGLPKSTRDSLPALNMNAHVFSTNAARSFVLINTKRYRIGDYLAEGPELVDILPDGAVLKHRGEQFLLPVAR